MQKVDEEMSSKKYTFDVNGRKIKRTSSELKRALNGAILKYLRNKDEHFFRAIAQGKAITLEIKLLGMHNLWEDRYD
jgi:imidazoleglycerol phosphate dehydratase HisB